MYSAEQILVLQKIVLLRDSKFTTLEIKDIIQRCNEVDILEELQVRYKVNLHVIEMCCGGFVVWGRLMNIV